MTVNSGERTAHHPSPGEDVSVRDIRVGQAPRRHRLWSAVGAGLGVVLALGWSVLLCAINGLTWWRTGIGYDGSLILLSGMLIVGQFIGAIAVLASATLLVWRRARPFAIGVLGGCLVGVGRYFATDAVWRHLADTM